MSVTSFDPYKTTVYLKYSNFINGEAENLKEVQKFVQRYIAQKWWNNSMCYPANLFTLELNVH